MNYLSAFVEMEKTAGPIGEVLGAGVKGIGSTISIYPVQSAMVGGAGALLAAIMLANQIGGLSNWYYNHNQLDVARKQKQDLESIVSLLKPPKQNDQSGGQQLIPTRLS